MAKKRCARCGEEKFKKDFSPNPKSADGRFSWCKSCKAEYQLAYKTALKQLDPEAYRARLQREKIAARYGLYPGGYEDMFEMQGGVCAACGREPKTIRLSIDHEHAPNEKNRQPWERMISIRGLLCQRCNRVLGAVGDDPQLLRSLADYLEAPPAKPFLLEFWRRVVSYLEAYEKRKPQPPVKVKK